MFAFQKRLKIAFAKTWKAKNDFSVNLLVENLPCVYAWWYMVNVFTLVGFGYQLLNGGGDANNGFISVFAKSINLFLQGNTVYLKVLEMLI